MCSLIKQCLVDLLIPKLLNFIFSGLQIGFFLERAGRDYIIFERENLAGILLKDNGTCMSIRATPKTLSYRFQLD